jgi:hypothetical protein
MAGEGARSAAGRLLLTAAIPSTVRAPPMTRRHWNGSSSTTMPRTTATTGMM